MADSGLKPRHIAIPAIVLSLVTPILVREEGLVTHAYKDPVGIWTACVGDTQGVHPGQTFTRQECLSRLQARLPDYYTPIASCRPQITSAPATVQAAVLSFAYNEGPGRVCSASSTIGAAISSSNWKQVCEDLMLYTRAGNNPTMLLGRRARERAVCMEGLQ